MNNPSPMTDRLPRALKRTAGRTEAEQVPAHIRCFGVTLDQEERAAIRQRLGVKLGKYATSTERVSVRVSDVNGPRGSVDKICHIKVALEALPSVIFESQASSVNDAVNGALIGVEQAVRRSIQSRRMKPREAAAGGHGAARPGAPSDQER